VSGGELPEALAGLFEQAKRIPTWMLYDAAGCELYERITTLPEYYLTRAETEVFESHADALIEHAATGADSISLAELGAGSATKTELLIEAGLRKQGSLSYLAADIAPEALEEASARLQEKFDGLEVRTFAGTHQEAGPAISAMPGRQILLFLGSSIGNYSDAEAIELLADVRKFLREDALFVLGTDLKKHPKILHAAYNDSQGVTAAFTTNVLTRLNREYGCNFSLSAFRHSAEWIEKSSNLEVGLESLQAQRVLVSSLDRELVFQKGERIHIENSAKYDAKRVEGILASAGYKRQKSFLDPGERYAVQVAALA